ncbi:MAG: Gfo/Idh/MocA family oxidoreductase [Opitutaceae bacterium]|nr:Gfo/Idh/MocA family oxidoreductase [Cytophagales bacterium]
MRKQVKWGIIGPGSIAREFTEDLKFIKDEDHFVKAIVGHGKETTEKYLAENKVDLVYYHLEDLINSHEIDCVYIATPHPQHYDTCLRLLESKIPVLCEKPLAISERQVREIIKKSKETQTFFMEGMWVRCLPSILKVLEIIESGKIGEIHSLSGKLTYKAPFDIKNRYFNPELGGGSLLDLGVYPAYLSYLILGKPESIKASSKNINGVDASTAAILTHKSGAISVIESSFVSRGTNEAIIYGDKGSIHIAEPWNEKPLAITVQIYYGQKEVIIPEWEGKGLYFEVQEMMKCINGKKIESTLLTHQGSLELIQILDEIRNQTNVKYPNE